MLSCLRGFPGSSAALEARVVKHPPAMQETRVQSLSLEGPLEKGMATRSIQYYCLEKPRDRGAWQATVSGVAKRVRLDLAIKQQLL